MPTLRHNGMRSVLAGVAVAASLAGGSAAATPAADGAQLAVDHGCMNCHSNQSHTAPTLKHLTEKLTAKGDSPEVLRHLVAELRGQTGIRGHQAASDESLLVILQWMAQGAK
jgi:cytochrome c551/c552